MDNIYDSSSVMDYSDIMDELDKKLRQACNDTIMNDKKDKLQKRKYWSLLSVLSSDIGPLGSYFNVVGVVISTRYPKMTISNTYSYSFYINDYTLKNLPCGVNVNVFKKCKQSIPNVNHGDIVILKDAKFSIYQTKKQFSVSDSQCISIIKSVDFSKCLSSESTIKEVKELIAKLRIYRADIPALTSFSNITYNSNTEICIIVYIVGVYKFFNINRVILAVTDRSKCSFKTYSDFHLSQPDVIAESTYHSTKYYNRLMYIYADDDYSLCLENVRPTETYKMILNVEFKQNHVKLNFHASKNGLVLLDFIETPLIDDQLSTFNISLIEHAKEESSLKQPHLMNLGNFNVPNTQSNFDDYNTPSLLHDTSLLTIAPSSFDDYLIPLPNKGNNFTLVRTTLEDLTRLQQFIPDTVFNISASLVYVKQKSFQDSISAYCKDCNVILSSNNLHPTFTGTLICKDCNALVPAHLRMTLLLKQNRHYLYVDLLDQKVLDLFSTNSTIRYLNYKIAETINSRHSRFFQLLSDPTSMASSFQTRGIYLRCISNNSKCDCQSHFEVIGIS